jgi:hypothetical protein
MQDRVKLALQANKDLACCDSGASNNDHRTHRSQHCRTYTVNFVYLVLSDESKRGATFQLATGANPAYVTSSPRIQAAIQIRDSRLAQSYFSHVETTSHDRDAARKTPIREPSRASLPLATARDLDQHLQPLPRPLAPLEHMSTRLAHAQGMR